VDGIQIPRDFRGTSDCRWLNRTNQIQAVVEQETSFLSPAFVGHDPPNLNHYFLNQKMVKRMGK